LAESANVPELVVFTRARFAAVMVEQNGSTASTLPGRGLSVARLKVGKFGALRNFRNALKNPECEAIFDKRRAEKRELESIAQIAHISSLQ
jgi:hypothetical protein